MLSRVALALLLTIPLSTAAHSLEPAYRIIRFQQGITRFPMTAINAFNHTEDFEVEVFADDSFSEPLEFTAIPWVLRLQPQDGREFTIEMSEVAQEDFLVCTRTHVDNGSTRICSRVIVCEPYASNTECKRRVQQRRGSYFLGR